MNVVYSMSTEAKRGEAIVELARRGYKATATRGSGSQPICVRVWQVPEADGQSVVQMILRVDPGAREKFPKPSYTHD